MRQAKEVPKSGWKYNKDRTARTCPPSAEVWVVINLELLEMNGQQTFYPELQDMNDPHLSVPLTIPSDHKEAISSLVVIPLELWLHLE